MKKSVVLSATCVALTVGCGSRATVGELADGSGSSGDGGTSQTNDTNDSANDTIDVDTGDPNIPVNWEGWDILFVIDNSGSMGEEQASLASGVAALLNPLDEQGVAYRIGITTTDNGNFWCSGGQGGAMRLSSCRSRPQEFVFTGNPPIDATQEACIDVCAHDTIATSDQSPWLQNIDGNHNVMGGISLVEALQCALPQGINGCGFESHLESTYKAIERAQDPAEPSFGFLRPEAGLAIIYISDEVDCSTTNQAIFQADGSKVFWSDPMSGSPTSAVCWNAGVQCDGGPGTYSSCSPVDLDENGLPANPGAGVLLSVDRYLQQFGQLEAQRDRPVVVYGIVGVPGGFPSTTLVYEDGTDPVFRNDFGIGPGCDGPTGRGVPPVRLRSVMASHGGDDNMFSICEPSQVGAFSAIAAGLLSQTDF